MLLLRLDMMFSMVCNLFLESVPVHILAQLLAEFM